MSQLLLLPEQSSSKIFKTKFKLRIDPFSEVNGPVYNLHTDFNYLKWKLRVEPETRHGEKHFQIFLYCNDGCQGSWSCCVMKGEIRVVSQNGGPPLAETFKCIPFEWKNNCFYLSYFASWDELIAPERGLIKGNCIIFEVILLTDAPKGVSYDPTSQIYIDYDKKIGPIKRADSGIPHLVEVLLKNVQVIDSRAKYQVKITNLTHLQGKVLSGAILVSNVPWRIMLRPKRGERQEEEKKDRKFGLFLECNGRSSGSWRYFAEVTYFLVRPNANRERQLIEFSWEQSIHKVFEFYLNQCEKGRMKNDEIILEMTLLVLSTQKNILNPLPGDNFRAKEDKSAFDEALDEEEQDAAPKNETYEKETHLTEATTSSAKPEAGKRASTNSPSSDEPEKEGGLKTTNQREEPALLNSDVGCSVEKMSEELAWSEVHAQLRSEDAFNNPSTIEAETMDFEEKAEVERDETASQGRKKRRKLSATVHDECVLQIPELKGEERELKIIIPDKIKDYKVIVTEQSVKLDRLAKEVRNYQCVSLYLILPLLLFLITLYLLSFAGVV